MIIGSIDPGIENFAFCIVGVDEKSLSTSSSLKDVYKASSSILIEVISLKDKSKDKNKKEKKSKTNLDYSIFVNLTTILDKYREYWDKCSIIIIETQMSFGDKVNVKALKVAQHCYSYFSIFYANFKTVLNYPAYHKYHALECPKGMTKPQRKKWAVEKAQEIWIGNNDFSTLQLVSKYRKKDDLCDSFIQAVSFIFLKFCKKRNFN
jgi:hypothetical protein